MYCCGFELLKLANCVVVSLIFCTRCTISWLLLWLKHIRAKCLHSTLILPVQFKMFSPWPTLCVAHYLLSRVTSYPVNLVEPTKKLALVLFANLVHTSLLSITQGFVVYITTPVCFLAFFSDPYSLFENFIFLLFMSALYKKKKIFLKKLLHNQVLLKFQWFICNCTDYIQVNFWSDSVGRPLQKHLVSKCLAF